MKNELSIRNQDKVFRKILSLPLNDAGYIYRPAHFEDNFPFISSIDNLRTILHILSFKELIEVELEYNSEECFIHTLAITIKGYDYFAQKRKENIAFWLPLITSSVLSVCAILVSLLTLLLK